MIRVEVDPEFIEKEFKAALKKRLDELESEKVFWDMKTLAQKTSMSISHLEKHVIYQPGFPLHRVGKKRIFPAKEAQEFLLDWVKNY
ncbi:hypothetical protein HMI01_14750 [Halolactibacillus miurensis]|uniref:Helix-turn-helix domain-containing protein n=1 Tax=Halolactibacillus miurensis TaxID=306541 RepID=A0A1I6S1T4_9BACI|nr:hypothetical protein [Halolactibacillus miurensis]GEM04487.1 hypothetical protein HMI01_14750 [Halolactibacillus miurensis]SFS70876.1 hypothetical protein SAMN05421668_10785 [Halolactibacillus miurensis]